MHQVDVDAARSSVSLITEKGRTVSFALLHELTLAANAGLPENIQGALTFVGYGLNPARSGPPEINLQGRVAVYFNSTPAGLTEAERSAFVALRLKVLRTSGAVAMVGIANPANIEPARWPAAYMRAMSLKDKPAQPNPQPAIAISAEAAAKLFDGAYDYAALLRDGMKGAPLPTFALESTLRLHLVLTHKDISSSNIIASLPGSDPALSSEYVALSAHLDGYGYGTPVDGDALYNGALDDAAYVATLIELGRHQGMLPPALRPRRSLLFCIFTAEEKGLLGAVHFTSHPTVPIGSMVADLNLDQLRPIFPLRALTMHGLKDSTLGDTARMVAEKFSIELRPDLEPERNLFRRVDSYYFATAGVPIASFIFGYDRGSREEAIYRDWYNRRYHRPQDDLNTPIDWAAADKFNRFYEALAVAVANQPARPAWSPSSYYAPRP
jgi:Zn-dependent M28 family amino/carboxypeptidase